jgi:fructan beta-fructosidase
MNKLLSLRLNLNNSFLMKSRFYLNLILLIAIIVSVFKVVGQPTSSVILERKILINANYIHLPLMYRDDARRKDVQKFTIEDKGEVLRFIHLEFAGKDQQPDFIYSYDVREFLGREITIRFKSIDTDALNRLILSNEEIIDTSAYSGLNRPRFHFSPRLGWMNDINGTYYYDGLYHLFYQFNPTTTARSAGFDMHWGHSVSKDLIHWEEWPVALFPDKHGQCFSGTAILVNQHIPGVNENVELPSPVIFFTATGHGQHMATTNDGGRTWQRYANNPVVPVAVNNSRDPKVFWDEKSNHYVMLLYVPTTSNKPEGFTIYRSKNLTKWEEVSHIPYWFECPEFIPMKSAVTGENLMLLYGCYRAPENLKEKFNSNSAYQLGHFDGTKFTAVTKPRHAHLGDNFYGAITFSNEPSGEHIMMGWARERSRKFPNEPFNQCATVPLRMTLKAINDEDVLCFEPVEQINFLRGKPLIKEKKISVAKANAKLSKLTKECLLDVIIKISSEDLTKFDVNIRDLNFSYNGKDKLLQYGSTIKKIHPDKQVDVRILVDRGIVESFWNGGEAAFSKVSFVEGITSAISLEGDLIIDELIVYPMKSIWKVK